jgi:hypothetical protein
VYRPQPVPKVLQGKIAVSQQPQQRAQPTHQPVAPPVYRPQPKLIQPQLAMQARTTTATKVSDAQTMQAKVAPRFSASSPVATAQRKNPPNSLSPARPTGRLPVAQLKPNLAPQSPGRPLLRNAVIQPKWVDEHGKDLYWDQLVDGVQWHADRNTGEMYYEVKDASMIKLGSESAYRANAGKRSQRQTWLNHSAAGFDILANVDASVVKPQTVNEGVLDTSDERLKIFKPSQFKDIYKIGETQLLSVFKNCNSSQVLGEVAALHKIAQAGFATPNPKVIEVIHKGKKTMGILMDKVEGVFVDMAKVSNEGIIGFILNEAAAGREVNTSEFGIISLLLKMKQKWVPPSKQALAAICEDLSKLLKTQDSMVINDLQFMVKRDGRIVIIDPQWAGHIKMLVSHNELKFIRDTYERMQKALAQLQTGESQQQSASPLGNFGMQGSLSSSSSASYMGPSISNTDSKFFF